MGMSGDTALALAKSYVKKTLKGQGALKGQDGFSPTVKENPNNTADDYRFDVTDKNGTFTTPNLKGYIGADGFSPTATVTKDGNVTTITLTDKNGTTSEMVYDGQTNVIESVTVNGVEVPIVDKTVNIDLTGYVKKEDGKTLVSNDDVAQIAKNKADIATINGTGEGSVDKKIADKLSEQTYLTKEIATADEIAAYIADPSTAKFNVIYLVKDESTTGADKYFEYQRIGTEESSEFVMTGDTSTDLSDYAKKTDVETVLENYSTTEEMNTAINQSAESVKQEAADTYTTKEEFEGVKEVISKKTAKVYSFHINGNESNPSDAVTYLDDAVGMTPAYMDFSNNKFNYGSWGNAFFMPRPCMLEYDGTLDYYLDPNDYSKKIDGTASDIADISYEGNAMIEWGAGGKIWYKIIPDGNDQSSATISFANAQMDSDYVDWSFHNYNGNIVDRFYTPIYNGSTDGTRLRSMSGQVCIQKKTAQQEIDLAKANNVDGNSVWNTEILSDIQLVNLLLVLIGKSLDTQSVFGRGNDSGHVNDSSQNYGMLNSGTMNKKGMFWGSNDGTSGVKVFGMENWWGNQWRRYAGDINDNGVHKVKYTYGTEDGSTEVGFNTTGQGYKVTNEALPSASGSYIQKMKFEENEISPLTESGTSSTYYCDGLWTNNEQVNYARCSGHCDTGAFCGAFCLALSTNPAYAWWGSGASLSCKPLA